MRGVFFAGGLALGGIASDAMALTPIPQCVGDALGTPYEVSDYSASPLGKGFVWYTTVEVATDAWLSILEYCPEQRQLVMRQGMPGDDRALNDAAVLEFQDMVFQSEAFTMDQMAARLRDLGANAEIRRVSYVSCACATN